MHRIQEPAESVCVTGPSGAPATMRQQIHDGFSETELEQRRRDMAERTSVSRTTASAVIGSSHFVSQELRDRVTAAIEQLNRAPDIVARSVNTKRTRGVRLLWPSQVSPVWTVIATTVCDIAYEARLARLGY